MSAWRGYLGIENIALDAAQKASVVAALRKLGPKSHTSPARLMHWRTRLDGDAAIFECLFDADTITIESVKAFLATAVGVSPAVISDAVAFVTFGGQPTPVVTYSAGGTARLRVAVFAGLEQDGEPTTWEQSHDAVLAYLAENRDAWEGAE